MQNPSFKYHIYNNNLKPIYIDEVTGFIMEGNAATLLTVTGKPAALRTSPSGWKDVLIKYARNIEYLGLFRDFTVPLDFKEDGAKIMRYLFYTYGIEAIGYLALSKLNRLQFPDLYEKLYLGEIDFSKFHQKKDGVTVSITEGGLSKLLKAYENVKYEIEITFGGEYLPVTLGGLPFRNNVTGIFYYSTYFSTLLVDPTKTFFVAMATVNQEGSTQGILIQDVNNVEATSHDDNWFLSNESKTVNFSISGNLTIINYLNVGNNNIKITIDRVNNGVQAEQFTIYDDFPGQDVSVTFSFNFSISSTPLDKFYIVTTVQSGTGYHIESGEFNINYDVTFTDSVINGLSPYLLWQRLVEKMTGGKYKGESDFLKPLRDILITSGQGIRGEDVAKITTSVKDFFRFARLMDKSGIGVGMGIVNNELRIERLDYFFKNEVVIELGEIADPPERVVAEDLCFNTIKVGYANQTHDATNGKDDFAVTQVYTTVHTRIVRELDLTCPYIASPYSIELLRLNLSGKETTDNKGDNETFIINIQKQLNPDGTYHLNRPAYTSITGVLFPQGIFNTELSPKHLFFNCGAYIHSVLDKQDASLITFQNGEKNSELSTTLNGVTVTEKSNVTVSTLPAKIFLPYYDTINTEVQIDFLDLMQVNNYNKIGYTTKQKRVEGYMVDGGMKPATLDKQTWKLLLAPSTDLLQFINE